MPENNKICFLTGNIKLIGSDYIKIAGTAAVGTAIGILAAKFIWSRLTRNRTKEIKKIVDEVIHNNTTE